MKSAQKNKVDPILKLVLLLIVLGVAFVYSYPIISRNFPEFAQSFDSFRGAYYGPFFQDVPADFPRPYFSDAFMRFQFTQKTDPAPSFYFVPAVDAEYEAHVRLADSYDIRGDLYLIEEGREIFVDSTSLHSWIRPRTMPIDEIPEFTHASGFTFQAWAGKVYRFDVIYEDSRGDGMTAYAGVVRVNTEVDLSSLLGYWLGGLVVFYILRILLLFRKMNKLKKG